MENLIIHSQQTENYEIKTKKYQGKTHLVVPVVMMVEGVHNGSHGKIFHSSEQLAKHVESWNVMPVVIQHPEKDGKFISANSPDVLELQRVGQIFNTKIENKRLIAEAWLDEEKLKEISMKAYKAIKNGEPLDVSVGMFNDEDEEMGNYSGTDYKGIASNYKPDHLALLPGGRGACSWADGCGIRANQDNVFRELLNGIQDFIDTYGGPGPGHSGHTGRPGKVGGSGGGGGENKYEKVAEGHFSDMDSIDKISKEVDKLIEEKAELRKKINEARENPGMEKEMNKLSEQMLDIMDKIEIGTKKMRKMAWDEKSRPTANKDLSVYKQEYQVNASGVVVLIGDPEELINKQKEVKIMSNAKDCPKCLDKVNALLANTASGWTETDREWLLAQDEDKLDRLMPKIVEKTIEVNKLSASDQADLAWARKQREENRAKLIKDIQTNAKGVWTEDELKAMSEATLEKVLSSTGVDHSLNGSVINANAGTIAPLGGPEMVEIK